MKLFIFSDVHGFYDELQLALNNAGFDINNPDHIIVSCGDLLDRGTKPMQCLKFVNGIPDNRKFLICGNHEVLLNECLDRGDFLQHDYHNGTAQTVSDIGDYGLTTFNIYDMFNKVRHNKELNRYMESVIDYAKIKNNVFVHGWIPCKINDPNKYHARDLVYTFDENWERGDWDRARWINGADAWQNGVRIDGCTIFCGHWHCSWPRKYIEKTGVEFDTNETKADFSPWYGDGICCIDACTAYSHKVNVVVLDVADKEIKK